MPRPLVIARAGVVALLLVAGTAGSALAQGQAQPSDRQRQRDRGGDDNGGRRGGFGGGMFGGRGMFEPAVTSKSLESYSKILNLSSEQQAAAKALLEGYQQNVESMSQEQRDKMSELRDSMRGDDGPNPDGWRKFGEEMEKFRKKRTDLDQGFMNDLKAVLTPQQAEKWPTVERMARREQTIGRGLMSGERVDLVRLVDNLKLDDKARKNLDPVLDQYAADLDRELVARNAAYDSAQSKVREAFQSGDMSAMDKIMEDGRTASKRVRDVNRRYARQIEGLLPEDARPGFNDEFRRESFPLIYRQTYGSRALKAASELSDLNAEQKTTVQAIQDSYTRDLAAVNKDMEEAAQKREDSVKAQDLMPGPGRRGGFGAFLDDPDISKLRERRDALQDAAIEKLKKALTPEQFGALPKRGDDRGDRADRGDVRGRARDNQDQQDDQPARPRRRGNGNRDDRPAAPRTPAPGPTR